MRHLAAGNVRRGRRERGGVPFRRKNARLE